MNERVNDFALAFAVWLLVNHYPSLGFSYYPKRVSSDPLTEQSKASDLLGLAVSAVMEQDRGRCPWDQYYIWAMTKQAEPSPICLSTMGRGQGATSLSSSPYDTSSQRQSWVAHAACFSSIQLSHPRIMAPPGLTPFLPGQEEPGGALG